MSLHPKMIAPVPEETSEIAHQAFAKGNVYMQMRDELGSIFTDDVFTDLASDTVGTWSAWVKPVDATPSASEGLVVFEKSDVKPKPTSKSVTFSKVSIIVSRLITSKSFMDCTNSFATI